MAEKRVHPMSWGEPYTFVEFETYALSVGRDVAFASKMWEESKPFDSDAIDYGNWSEVVSKPESDRVVFNLFEKDCSREGSLGGLVIHRTIVHHAADTQKVNARGDPTPLRLKPFMERFMKPCRAAMFGFFNV